MNSNRWQVLIHRRAEKVLKRLEGDLLERMRRVIRNLSSEPFPEGVKKLAGQENLYRVRVGDWRIIYAVEKDRLIVLVLEIAPRSGSYKGL